jgi:hypothetical protein
MTMGMDLYARRGSASFSTSVWQWRPIHQLMAELCSDILDKQMLEEMASNEGAGPTSQKICDVIADRFERYLAEHPEGLQLDSRYAASPKVLQEFIDFLRICGGFRVC